MNETPSTLPASASGSTPPKTSGLAIWSLVLGILGLLCFSIFTAVPAVICGHMAKGRIKGSGGTLGGNGLAIGGLVTGYLSILVTVIAVPLMLLTVLPNLASGNQAVLKNECLTNLRAIESAKETWAMEYEKPGTAVPTQTDLEPYLGETQKVFTCPAGGIYSINKVEEPPSCSAPGHQLPGAASSSP